MLLSYHEADFDNGKLFILPNDGQDSPTISADSFPQSSGHNQTEPQQTSAIIDPVTLPAPVALNALPPPPGPPPRGPPPAPPKGKKTKQRTSATAAQSTMPTPIVKHQGRKVRGPVQPPPLEIPIVRDAVWKVTANLATMQRDILLMAAAPAEILLANIKSDLPILKNGQMYKELEAVKKRWMFSCLNQNDSYVNWIHQNNFDPQNVEESANVTPSVLALYERSCEYTFYCSDHNLPLSNRRYKSSLLTLALQLPPRTSQV